MQQAAARLDIPGQPVLLGQREDEPVSSRFTGKPLRRICWTLAVYGDSAQEQLQAALTSASNGDDLIPDGKGGRWGRTLGLSCSSRRSSGRTSNRILSSLNTLWGSGNAVPG